MANDSSLQGDAVQFAFDLDSQLGVTHLLASVRASDIGAEKKNELRDLIFLYTNGGKDQSVRITLEQKIHTYKLVPIPPTTKSVVADNLILPETKYPFGTSRPSPSFRVATKSAAGLEKSPVPVSKPAATPEPIPEVVPKPVPPSPLPEQKPLEASVPLPTHRPVTTPPPTPETISTPPAVSQTPGYDPNQNLQRIREIKSLVNDQVGNPVNLVDIDNEVGREYMSALLDAMKKLNNGTSALSAMKRLEEAYLKVEKTLAEHNKKLAEEKLSIPTIATFAPPVPEPIKKPEPIIPPEQPKPERSEPIVVKKTEPEVSHQRFELPVVPPVMVPKSVENNEVQKPVPISRVTPPPTPTEPKVRPVEEVKKEVSPQLDKPDFIPGKKTDLEVPTPWVGGGKATDRKETEVTPAQSDHAVFSLAQFKTKLRTPDDLPLASSLETSSMSGDPLFTREVDEGLQQLLSEWILFKKSGLFGTGPKGREHPLFLKVADLQIPLLLAGRFEGATQEVKQSITDYMNGWRYEQGIIYVQGETFEHYLRRVIRHILDLQKRKVVR